MSGEEHNKLAIWLGYKARYCLTNEETDNNDNNNNNNQTKEKKLVCVCVCVCVLI